MKNKGDSIVDILKEKHKKRLALALQSLKRRRPYQTKRHDSYISDVRLFSKWAYRVGRGWYGFSLGDVPVVWTDVLEEFLCWLEVQCPDFEIHQVKMKIRGLRFYVGTKTELVIPSPEIRAEVSKLQKLLTLPPLATARATRQKSQKHSQFDAPAKTKQP